ncbi:MAG: protein kinase [Chitinivibrionales bacterium]|nr:protein kinase [Chitinivibrionales bacterium]MBD3356525.1 protein kinase [Chitinivibrionales bacterium]
MRQEKPSNSEPQEYNDLLQRTIPEEAFSAEAMHRLMTGTVFDDDTVNGPGRYLERTRGSTNSPNLSTEASTGVNELVDASRLPDYLLDNPDLPGRRYIIGERIGKGATGRVYSIKDLSLDRTVAMKILTHVEDRNRKRRAAFIYEARSTAKLEHTNILPVYDIGATDKGEIYFTTKKVSGVSLGDALRQVAESGNPPPEIASIGDVLAVALKVCDALDYAHDQGYIHQDVKPDNIMLSRFGEVLLLDWGSARLSGKEEEFQGGAGLVGTPAYMSPEQAKRERADDRSDIYCMGATLFHALFGRFSVWDRDPEAFWEKKRSGTLDPLTEEEQSRIPRRLRAIVLKSLEADPAKRYQRIREMADDLKAYQHGLAVTAYRESSFERALRWYRRNRRAFWAVTIPLILISTTGYLLLREKLKEMIVWRRYYHESFASADIRSFERDWIALQVGAYPTDSAITAGKVSANDAWRLDEGAIVSKAGDAYENLTFRHRVPGNIRVEWDVTSLRSNLNYNCYIGGRNRKEGYMFHVAGWGKPEYVVLTKKSTPLLSGENIADYAILAQPMKTNRVYRFRMEKEGRHVRLFIDGQCIIDYEDYEALSGPESGTFGFENSFHNIQRIDNVMVYYQPLPRKLSPLTVADQFFNYGMYRRALLRYREVYEWYPKSVLAGPALFNVGRCRLALDSIDAALATFREFLSRSPKHELAPWALYAISSILCARERTAAVESTWMSLARRYPGHGVLKTIHFGLSDSLRSDIMRLVRDSVPFDSIVPVMERHRRVITRWGREFELDLSHNSLLEYNATLYIKNKHYRTILENYRNQREYRAKALLAMRRAEDVLREYPELRRECASALLMLGRHKAVLETYPELRRKCAEALFKMDSLRTLRNRYPDQRYLCALSLFVRGKHQVVLSQYADQSYPAVSSLIHLGKADEILTRYPMRKLYYARHLIHTGRAREILRLFPNDPRLVMTGLVRLGKENEFLRRFPQQEDLCAEALYRARRYTEIIERYPHLRRRTALALLAIGESEKVVRDYGDIEELCVEALLVQGKFDLVRKRYSHLRTACAEARLRAGEYEAVLMRDSTERAQQARALIALGSLEEVVEDYWDIRSEVTRVLMMTGRNRIVRQRFRERRGSLAAAFLLDNEPDSIRSDRGFSPLICAAALLAQERYDEVIRRYPSERHQVQKARYLKALADYSPERGWRGPLIDEESRERINWYEDGYENCFRRRILFPLTNQLLGVGEGLLEYNAADTSLFRNVLGRRLWYDLAFIVGAIDLETYRRQPYRPDPAAREPLCTAMRADLAGDSAAARAAYGRYRFVSSYHPVHAPHALEGFVRWRLRALENQEGPPQTATH